MNLAGLDQRYVQGDFGAFFGSGVDEKSTIYVLDPLLHEGESHASVLVRLGFERLFVKALSVIIDGDAEDFFAM